MASQEVLDAFLNPTQPAETPATFSIDNKPPTVALPGDTPATGPLPDLPGTEPITNKPVVPASWQDKARIIALILEVFETEGFEAAQKIQEFVKKTFPRD